MTIFDKSFALSIGPQRSGGAFLKSYFKAHDDVALPERVDEVFFFDRHFHRGDDFYATHFDIGSQHKIVMELTTTIFDVMEAPDRVYDFAGDDVNLFCFLRNPLERAFAVFKDLSSYGIVNGAMEEAVEQSPQILHASRYHIHLGRWFNVFGQENIKIFSYEQLCRDPQSVMSALCDYLSIPETPLPEDIIVPEIITPSGPDADWLAERLGGDIELYNTLVSDAG